MAAGARKAERMAVGVPSHCPLLAPVAERLEGALATVEMADPRIPYVDNRRARAVIDAILQGDSDLAAAQLRAHVVVQNERFTDLVALAAGQKPAVPAQ